ncbi:uncharacterized protein A4U43_C04F10240 [Asparagus officinalis]|uniref:Uncharacterized protein n=1 Tax=Asparagus officinalis TaxID=4686 RepID=A0A5P1EZQ8_ASPOF|nr:uncharacterized protein A4U43_C04F10240 [Asparagus officinalis]
MGSLAAKHGRRLFSTAAISALKPTPSGRVTAVGVRFVGTILSLAEAMGHVLVGLEDRSEEASRAGHVGRQAGEVDGEVAPLANRHLLPANELSGPSTELGDLDLRLLIFSHAFIT